MNAKKSLLIVSFSPIVSDARVLKQVRLFQDRYAVTTCGYGAAPEGVVEHLQLPDRAIHWQYANLPIVTHQYRRAYWENAAVKAARQQLAGKHFDAVLANDFDTVPLALSLKPRYGVHADLHEYAPLEKEQLRRWKWFISPFRAWICRTYISQAQSWSTVAQGIAEKYQEEFGFLPRVVTNAAPFTDLQPTAVHHPIKLVHHGVAHPDRNLDRLAQAVHNSRLDCTVDFFLVPTDPGVISVLTQLSELDSRIRVHDPLPYAQILPTLNDFDCGIYTLPPVSFNNDHALPNKFFDFIQARLGILIGPSPEMAAYVHSYGLGAVAHDFSAAAFTELLDSVTPEHIVEWKAAAQRVAQPLSAQEQSQGWADAIAILLGEVSADE